MAGDIIIIIVIIIILLLINNNDNNNDDNNANNPELINISQNTITNHAIGYLSKSSNVHTDRGANIAASKAEHPTASLKVSKISSAAFYIGGVSNSEQDNISMLRNSHGEAISQTRSRLTNPRPNLGTGSIIRQRSSSGPNTTIHTEKCVISQIQGSNTIQYKSTPSMLGTGEITGQSSNNRDDTNTSTSNETTLTSSSYQRAQLRLETGQASGHISSYTIKANIPPSKKMSLNSISNQTPPSQVPQICLMTDISVSTPKSSNISAKERNNSETIEKNDFSLSQGSNTIQYKSTPSTLGTGQVTGQSSTNREKTNIPISKETSMPSLRYHCTLRQIPPQSGSNFSKCSVEMRNDSETLEKFAISRNQGSDTVQYNIVQSKLETGQATGQDSSKRVETNIPSSRKTSLSSSFYENTSPPMPAVPSSSSSECSVEMRNYSDTHGNSDISTIQESDTIKYKSTPSMIRTSEVTGQRSTNRDETKISTSKETSLTSFSYQSISAAIPALSGSNLSKSSDERRFYLETVEKSAILPSPSSLGTGHVIGHCASNRNKTGITSSKETSLTSSFYLSTTSPVSAVAGSNSSECSVPKRDHSDTLAKSVVSTTQGSNIIKYKSTPSILGTVEAAGQRSKNREETNTSTSQETSLTLSSYHSSLSRLQTGQESSQCLSNTIKTTTSTSTKTSLNAITNKSMSTQVPENRFKAATSVSIPSDLKPWNISDNGINQLETIKKRDISPTYRRNGIPYKSAHSTLGTDQISGQSSSSRDKVNIPTSKETVEKSAISPTQGSDTIQHKSVTSLLRTGQVIGQSCSNRDKIGIPSSTETSLTSFSYQSAFPSNPAASCSNSSKCSVDMRNDSDMLGKSAVSTNQGSNTITYKSKPSVLGTGEVTSQRSTNRDEINISTSNETSLTSISYQSTSPPTPTLSGSDSSKRSVEMRIYSETVGKNVISPTQRSDTIQQKSVPSSLGTGQIIGQSYSNRDKTNVPSSKETSLTSSSYQRSLSPILAESGSNSSKCSVEMRNDSDTLGKIVISTIQGSNTTMCKSTPSTHGTGEVTGQRSTNRDETNISTSNETSLNSFSYQSTPPPMLAVSGSNSSKRLVEMRFNTVMVENSAISPTQACDTIQHKSVSSSLGTGQVIDQCSSNREKINIPSSIETSLTSFSFKSTSPPMPGISGSNSSKCSVEMRNNSDTLEKSIISTTQGRNAITYKSTPSTLGTAEVFGQRSTNRDEINISISNETSLTSISYQSTYPPIPALFDCNSSKYSVEMRNDSDPREKGVISTTQGRSTIKYKSTPSTLGTGEVTGQSSKIRDETKISASKEKSLTLSSYHCSLTRLETGQESSQYASDTIATTTSTSTKTSLNAITNKSVPSEVPENRFKAATSVSTPSDLKPWNISDNGINHLKTIKERDISPTHRTNTIPYKSAHSTLGTDQISSQSSSSRDKGNIPTSKETVEKSAISPTQGSDTIQHKSVTSSLRTGQVIGQNCSNRDKTGIPSSTETSLTSFSYQSASPSKPAVSCSNSSKYSVDMRNDSDMLGKSAISTNQGSNTITYKSKPSVLGTGEVTSQRSTNRDEINISTSNETSLTSISYQSTSPPTPTLSGSDLSKRSVEMSFCTETVENSAIYPTQACDTIQQKSVPSSLGTGQVIGQCSSNREKINIPSSIETSLTSLSYHSTYPPMPALFGSNSSKCSVEMRNDSDTLEKSIISTTQGRSTTKYKSIPSTLGTGEVTGQNSKIRDETKISATKEMSLTLSSCHCSLSRLKTGQESSQCSSNTITTTTSTSINTLLNAITNKSMPTEVPENRFKAATSVSTPSDLKSWNISNNGINDLETIRKRDISPTQASNSIPYKSAHSTLGTDQISGQSSSSRDKANIPASKETVEKSAISPAQGNATITQTSDTIQHKSLPSLLGTGQVIGQKCSNRDKTGTSPPVLPVSGSDSSKGLVWMRNDSDTLEKFAICSSRGNNKILYMSISAEPGTGQVTGQSSTGRDETNISTPKETSLTSSSCFNARSTLEIGQVSGQCSSNTETPLIALSNLRLHGLTLEGGLNNITPIFTPFVPYPSNISAEMKNYSDNQRNNTSQYKSAESTLTNVQVTCQRSSSRAKTTLCTSQETSQIAIFNKSFPGTISESGLHKATPAAAWSNLSQVSAEMRNRSESVACCELSKSLKSSTTQHMSSRSTHENGRASVQSLSNSVKTTIPSSSQMSLIEASNSSIPASSVESCLRNTTEVSATLVSEYKSARSTLETGHTTAGKSLSGAKATVPSSVEMSFAALSSQSFRVSILDGGLNNTTPFAARSGSNSSKISAEMTSYSETFEATDAATTTKVNTTQHSCLRSINGTGQVTDSSIPLEKYNPTLSPTSEKTLHLKPSEIRYTHDSIRSVFKGQHCRKKIGETLDDLVDVKITVDNIPRLSVIFRNGKWFTRDNRRLWVFKHFELLGGCTQISVTKKKYLYWRKFTTKNDGIDIRVRGEAGGTWYYKYNQNPEKYKNYLRNASINT